MSRKNKLLILTFILALFDACQDPDMVDSTIQIDLVTVDALTDDTLFVEAIDYPEHDLIDFSSISSHDYNFTLASAVHFDAHLLQQGQVEAVFFTRIEPNDNFYSSGNLFGFGGYGNVNGNPLGQTRFFFYTFNGQTTGELNLILSYGIYQGDTLGVDTISIDLSVNNVLIPNSGMNIKPSISDISNGERYEYSLTFPEELLVSSSSSLNPKLRTPVLFVRKARENYSLGTMDFPVLTNFQPLRWDSGHWYHDSVAVYPVAGIDN